MKNCYCGNALPYSKCCRPLLTGQIVVVSAEQLMRSRYTAYVMADVAYLIKTTHASHRHELDAKEVLQWSKQNQWIKLEILHVETNRVVFKAYFRDRSSKLNAHYEDSTFILENGIWYYVEGTFDEPQL
jgi:SEC-C motif-containing protein